MKDKIKINFRGIETKEFDSGVTLLEVSKSFAHYFNYPILIGRVDNDLAELNETLTRSYEVDFYDRSNYIGNSVYGRTLQFLLVVAVKKLFGEKTQLIIEHSIDKGFYCELANKNITKEDIKELETKMKELVDIDFIINRISVSRFDAIKFFESSKQMDKVRSLKYISNTYVNLYRIDDTYDYFYGKLAYSTKQINDFKLTYVEGRGFVVSYPTSYNPECTLDYVHRDMLFDKFLSYSKWGEKINIKNAADLNEVISQGKYAELISLSEVYYNNQLVNVAKEVADNNNIKLVLIAGPSSSGKTTTAKKLSIYLKSMGLNPKQISLDDYFLDREKTPVLANGELDTESLNTVDVNLFNKHLSKLLEGDEIELPVYNFVLGKREYKGNKMKLTKNDVIVIEGLHCLNDELTLSISRKNKYKIYLAPLTQINIDNHNRVHTSDTRKLRRIVRDNKYRGTSATETLKSWSKIREGEEKYIFPYQNEVDYIINSALIYEFGILKTYAEPLLYNVSEDDENYPEVLRLINLLKTFLPIPSEDVPADSVLREFIGRSIFY